MLWGGGGNRKRKNIQSASKAQFGILEVSLTQVSCSLAKPAVGIFLCQAAAVGTKNTAVGLHGPGPLIKTVEN